MADESDSDTLRGFDTGTETDSVASSRQADRNRRKKEKKKASAAAKKAAAAANGNGNGSAAAAAAIAAPALDPGVVVEYVSASPIDSMSDNPAFAELASVFSHFTAAEELMSGKAAASSSAADGDEDESSAAPGTSKLAAAADDEEEDGEGAHLSSKAKKRMKRLSIAELKQLVQKPEVVEAWDVTSDDPRLLVHLKSYRNCIPVPKHWAQKRKFLMGKRGAEKPPFQVRVHRLSPPLFGRASPPSPSPTWPPLSCLLPQPPFILAPFLALASPSPSPHPHPRPSRLAAARVHRRDWHREDPRVRSRKGECEEAKGQDEGAHAAKDGED